jgi:hypothetical protein
MADEALARVKEAAEVVKRMRALREQGGAQRLRVGLLDDYGGVDVCERTRLIDDTISAGDRTRLLDLAVSEAETRLDFARATLARLAGGNA